MTIFHLRRRVAVILAGLFVSTAASQGSVSSQAFGFYDSNSKPLLGPAFMNAVNSYLRRYEPRLIERTPEKIRMQADYDFLYDIDLIVRSDEYEIIVTLAEKTNRHSKAQNIAAHLSSGVHRAMQSELIRNARVQGRTDPADSN